MCHTHLFTCRLGSGKWRRSTYPFRYATRYVVRTAFQKPLRIRFCTSFGMSRIFINGHRPRLGRCFNMPHMAATNSGAGWGDASHTYGVALRARARAAVHVPHAPFFSPAWLREVATFHVPRQMHQSIKEKGVFPDALADPICNFFVLRYHLLWWFFLDHRR